MTASVSLRLVYAHISHSLLYLFWAAIYLYLVFIQQPINYCSIAAADWFWLRVPRRGLRDRTLKYLRLLLTRISPQLAERYLTNTHLGPYLGSDICLAPGQRKQLPLHSVSLQGCAWMLPYHIGVCEVLKREKVVDDKTIWLGSSGGALIACAAALDLDLRNHLTFAINVGVEAHADHVLGPAGKMSHYIGPHVLKSLPKDAHIAATGRLFISVTETPQDSKFYGNVLVSSFKSRQHIYDMLMASTYIPVYYETPVRPGRRTFYWDGGFSNNQPVLTHPDTGSVLTTTVSPSARMADISPLTQKTCHLENFIPCDHDDAMELYERGKADATDYVRRVLGRPHQSPPSQQKEPLQETGNHVPA